MRSLNICGRKEGVKRRCEELFVLILCSGYNCGKRKTKAEKKIEKRG